jgi:hypothetical protein
MSIVNRHDDRMLREAFLHRWWVGLVLAQRRGAEVAAADGAAAKRRGDAAAAVGFIQRFFRARLLHKQIRRNLNEIRKEKAR